MKKPILAAMVLLLCLRLAFPALAQELEPSSQPSQAPEPVVEPSPAPSEEPEPDPTIESEPDPTIASEPAPTAASEPDPTAESKPDTTAKSESEAIAEPVILSAETPSNGTAEGAGAEPEYSCDVAWGDLAFTCSTGIWNPETLSYEASWSPDTVTVTVTNTSAVPVVAAITPASTDESGIQVHVSPQNITLDPGASGNFTVWLTGTPADTFVSGEVATLTATIVPPSES